MEESLKASVTLRSPTRQSRYGDGASEATKDLPRSIPVAREQILRCAQDDMAKALRMTIGKELADLVGQDWAARGPRSKVRRHMKKPRERGASLESV
jgi:hypothetical protein